MNKEIKKINKRIEDMAKYCPYHIKGVCFVNLTHPAECDLICEMHGAFSLLDLAGYRKQKVGRWHYDEENECFVCDCGCSALNNYRGLSVNSNFCPHCGAKMEGDSDA